MCLQKIRILEKGDHYRKRYNYYDCGVCAACRQKAANSKVSKISSHHFKDSVCYFITLTYDNDHVPVCSKSDFIDLAEKKNLREFQLPVYRGIHSNEIIDFIDFDDFDDVSQIYRLQGVVTKHDKINPENNEYHYDLFSICYSRDVRNFFKRLRRKLSYKYKETVPISYFYSPEYGPDTFRFHVHLLAWFPSWLSRDEVADYIFAAWPYASEDLTKKYVEIALAGAHYVASYVNCDAAIPKILLNNFPLRQSHSLYFGFNEERFSLSEILTVYRAGDFGYDATTVKRDGTVKTTHFYYPKSLINRYFPKFKAFTQLDYITLVNTLSEPEKHLRFIKQVVCLPDENGKIKTTDGNYSYNTCLSLDYTSDSGIDYYHTNLVNIHGCRVSFSERELQYTINRINRCYNRFAELGYSRIDFARTVIDYLFARELYLYKQSCLSPDHLGINQPYGYNNILDVDPDNILTLLQYVELSSFDDLDSSLNPLNIHKHNELMDMYYQNIKHRKINNL